MKLNPLSRLADLLSLRKSLSESRRRKGRRARPVRPVIEALEDRTLLAVLPPALVTGHSSLTGTSTDHDQTTPALAVDPYNAQHLVAVFTDSVPGAGSTQKV